MVVFVMVLGVIIGLWDINDGLLILEMYCDWLL